MLTTSRYKSLQFHSELILDEATKEAIYDVIKATEQVATNKLTPLEGRGNVEYLTLPVLGRVALKRYYRGGVLGRYTPMQNLYLRLGDSRPYLEFEMLLLVAKFGVSVPTPLVAIEEGDLLYRGSLITKLIPDAQPLMRLSVTEACDQMPTVAKEVAILIENSIQHVDLHPGNIIVSPENKVVLLDFDRAQQARCRPNRLREFYIRRWRRAVLKHGLNEALIESFAFELRKLRYD